MRRLSTWNIIILNAYWVGLSIMWNSLSVIILPAVLLNFVPDSQKNSYLGLLTAFGLVLALIIQPISGALSDRWISRWGRRRPLIVAGTVVDFVFLALLGWAGGLWMLWAGYIGLQISSNLAHGPVQGLMPDLVPPEQLGAASGIKNLMDMGGLVLASLLMGRLVPANVVHPVAGMSVVMLVLAVSATITILGARERPSTDIQGLPIPRAGALRDMWRQVFRVDWKANTGYWWLIGSRFLFLFGIYGIQAFAQYFVRDRLAVANPVQTTGDLLAALVLALMVFAMAAGWVADRVGRRRVQAVAAVIGAVGALLLTQARSEGQLLLYGCVLGAGIGIFLTANWALANDLAPAGEAGKFLGLTNLATAGAGALGRMEGPLIDFFNNARPGEWLGYTLVFGAGAIFILTSMVLLIRVPERRRQPEPHPALSR